MMSERITHAVAAYLAGAAFYWRWESPQKLWTIERAMVLSATAISTLWNIYAAIGA